jgi:hypothetical protein
MATTYSDLAVRLLRDAATFFESVGEQNPPLKEQILDNAEVFREMGELVGDDSTGVLRQENKLRSTGIRLP